MDSSPLLFICSESEASVGTAEVEGTTEQGAMGICKKIKEKVQDYASKFNLPQFFAMVSLILLAKLDDRRSYLACYGKICFDLGLNWMIAGHIWPVMESCTLIWGCLMLSLPK